jgi:DeoR family transcriptional regulator, suf operon transcriptional repressor
MPELLRKQLLDTTRGRIVSLLQAGAQTSEEIAKRLGLTPSAVRVQITTMERDGVVRRIGKRPGTTRPSHLFELTREAEQLLSKAYIPMLVELVRAFAAELPAKQLNALFRRAGRALADELSRGKQPTGNLRSRVAAASEMMNNHLGATTRVETNGKIVIRGFGCPLAAVTGNHRGVCLAMESLVTEIVGTRVRECCDRGERPRCCFEIDSGHTRRPT